MENNNTIGNSASNLPSVILTQIVGHLPLLERVRCEGVNRHWRNALRSTLWTNVRKLDREIVFKGATPRQMARFNDVPLTALFRCIGRNLRELDLYSFRPYPHSNRSGNDILKRFIPQIAESIQLLTGLVTLDLRSFDLALFVDHLPPTLRTLQVTEWFSAETTEKLSEKCPLLEEFTFDDNRLISIPPAWQRVYAPRKKKNEPPPTASELSLEKHKSDKLGDDTLRVMATRCVHLQRLSLAARVLKEGALHQLAAMPSLVELEIPFIFGDSPWFRDEGLIEIAKRGQLKKFVLEPHSSLTDDSVTFLVEHCQSLVTLVLPRSSNLTERSLRAVLDEVHRRHGNPSRELPTGPLDPGIFYFPLDSGVGSCPIDLEMLEPNEYHPEIDIYFGPFIHIEEGPARDEAAGNPWLKIDYDSNFEKRKLC